MATKTKDTSKDTVKKPALFKIKISEEETERLLNQMFTEGFATIDFEIIPNKLHATIKTLSADDQLILERRMSIIEGSSIFVLHSYTIEVLSYTVLKYGESTFKDPEDAKQFLEKLPGVLLDKLIKIQNSFETQVKHILKFDKINEHFFESPSTLSE